jgi:hypothetical protein
MQNMFGCVHLKKSFNNHIVNLLKENNYPQVVVNSWFIYYVFQNAFVLLLLMFYLLEPCFKIYTYLFMMIF